MKKNEINEIEEQDLELTEQKDYSFISNVSITQYKSDISFKTLISGIEDSLYIIPKYQRKFIWTKEQVENLACSLIRGLPIPPIYMYRNDKYQFVILDGQQRILSLFLYYKGKFIKNTTNTHVELQKVMTDFEGNDELSFGELLNKQYPLKDVNYELKYYDENNNEKIVNINYEKLPKDIQRKLDFTNISVIDINVNSEEHKYNALCKIFENLNSGGTKLTNQEVRNGVYQSKFYDMLHKINENNILWRNIYGEKHRHSRDVELLLRFSAVEHYFKLENNKFNINNYKNSYPKLLNDFSNEAMKFDDEIINLYRDNIEKFIKRINVNERIPNLLLESLYLASVYIDGDYIIDGEICRDILDSKEYKETTASSSSSKSRVERRFNYVYERLSRYVKGVKK